MPCNCKLQSSKGERRLLLQAMHEAMESTQVALVLFSEEFFERPATKGELKVPLPGDSMVHGA